jgi:hypothetical protein
VIGYFGFLRETEIEVHPIDLSCGAGQIDCPECGGDGDWTKYHPEPEKGPYQCVVCKGTGKVLISI